MYGKYWRYVLPAVLLLALAFPEMAHAEQPPCLSLIPFNTPVGCIYAHLEPGTLMGDLDIISHTSGNGVSATGTLTITGLNYSALNYSTDQSGMTFIYRFYNIQESDNPDFGTWYTYKEISKPITVPGGGQVKDVSFKPAKSYIRGKVELTCDIKSFKGEDVGCVVMVDGTARGTLPAGGKTTLLLDAGSHTLEVDLGGSQAGLWAPGTFTKTLNVKASATIVKVSASFPKASHLKVTLDQPGVVGDFYLNGALAGTQVASIDQWVTGNKSYKIEVRNLADPAADDIYMWKDAASTTYLSAGKEHMVTLRLQKRWLKGFLNLTCRVTNPPADETLACNPVLDGTPVDPIPVGASAKYTLDPGSHKVEATLQPQGDWIASQVSMTVYVSAGNTSNRALSFHVKSKPTPTPTVPSGVTEVHGMIIHDTVWSGEIHVTGDVFINRTLTIRPGTTIRIAANSDVHNLNTYPPDELAGVNTGPETPGVSVGERFPDESHHISIWIAGKLIAVGTPDKPIVITSDSPTPEAGDWNRFDFEDGILSYAQVSYYRQLEGRHGTISNNVLSFSYAQAVGTNQGGDPIIEHNTVSYAFHELAYIDGPAMVRNNDFGPNPRSYGVGVGGICIAINNPAMPVIYGNTIHDCDHGVRLVHGANPALDINAILSANTFYNNNQNVVNERP